MKILVIGNGFDLEHGLPTKYIDFIKFVNSIKYLSTNINISKEYFEKYLVEPIKIDHNVKNYLIKDEIFEYNKRSDLIKELFELSRRNIWINYFNKPKFKDSKDKGWIDFESEISNVIKSLDYMNKQRIKYNSNNIEKIRFDASMVECEQDILESIEQMSIIEDEKILLKKNEILRESVSINNLTKDQYNDQVIKKLSKHLDEFIRCLEIYLVDCVEEIPVKYIAPDISSFFPDKILTFNYTKTFETLYDKKKLDKEYDYIHGKADRNNSIDKNNMVLGIDEYLDGEKKDKELDFIEFKKYYQRIYKQTGFEYNKWINNIKSNRNPNEIHIFGHSLDVTDKDILHKLLVESNREGNYSTKITIFYHDKKAYAQQIVNLVKIITQDKLTERVSGANPTIIFKQKSERIKR